MKAKIDPEACIGCGLCVGMCPEVFRMEGDKAVALPEEVAREHQASCKDAAGQCPVAAIKVEE